MSTSHLIENEVDTSDTYLLSAQNLIKKFGGVTALDSVSFNLKTGGSLGIMGPNGSGKTTIFNVLTGFLRADSGKVFWNGSDISKESVHRRARQGMVRTFQQSMLMPGLSVRENVDIAIVDASLSGREPVTADEILDFLGLKATQSTLGVDLSWGDSRLLGIGLALATRPRLLLMDEPFAGLNALSIERVSSLIHRLSEEGYSMCIVDHKVPHLVPLCDRLMVLVNGVVLAEGAPDDIISSRDVQVAYLGVT